MSDAERRIRWRAGMGDADAQVLVDKIDRLEKQASMNSKQLYVRRMGGGSWSEAALDGVAVEYTDDPEHNSEVMEDVAVAVAEHFWPLNIIAEWGWHIMGEAAPASCPKGNILVKSTDIL